MLLSISFHLFANSSIDCLTTKSYFSIAIEPHEVMVSSLFDAGTLAWFIGDDSMKCIEDEHLIVIHGSDYHGH